MSQARIERRLDLLDPWLDSRASALKRLSRRHRLLARNWSHAILNRLICGATLVLLAPAILAVWIAIKRSAPQKTVIGHSGQSPAVDQEAPVLLSIKPLRTDSRQQSENLKIGRKRAISA